jgi:hypothetical protein
MAHANALARWDDEGGAGAWAPGYIHAEDLNRPRVFPDFELMQLHTRIIALENLVVALLAEGSDNQRRKAHDMAAFISPKQGASPHYLTIQAAVRIRHLVDRGDYFSAPSSI